MKRNGFAILTAAVISSTLLLLTAPVQLPTALLSCDCESGITYDASLPLSHPANQCALKEQSGTTSWLQWAKGQSRSVSFHFLDLLELISPTEESSEHKERANRPEREAA